MSTPYYQNTTVSQFVLQFQNKPADGDVLTYSKSKGAWISQAGGGGGGGNATAIRGVPVTEIDTVLENNRPFVLKDGTFKPWYNFEAQEITAVVDNGVSTIRVGAFSGNFDSVLHMHATGDYAEASLYAGPQPADYDVAAIRLSTDDYNGCLLSAGGANSPSPLPAIIFLENLTSSDSPGQVLIESGGKSLSSAAASITLNGGDDDFNPGDIYVRCNVPDSTFNVLTNGAAALRASSIAGQPSLGFFTAPAIAKPSVTGSKSGSAALSSLITALSALGLVTDDTTP